MSVLDPSHLRPTPGRRGHGSVRRTRGASAVLASALMTLVMLLAVPAGAAGPGGALGPAGLAPRAHYVWPTGGPAVVVEPFDPPTVVWGAGHRGVDLAAPAGSPVLAASAGTVAFAGTVAGRPVVSIDHPDGLRTTYEPVEPSVSAGDAVAAGDVIGVLLAGHRSDGVDALHWGARVDKRTYVNPLRLLQPAVIRLKPVDGSPG